MIESGLVGTAHVILTNHIYMIAGWSPASGDLPYFFSKKRKKEKTQSAFKFIINFHQLVFAGILFIIIFSMFLSAVLLVKVT